MFRILLALAICVGLLLFLAPANRAAAPLPIPIGELLLHPEDHDGTAVAITGEVQTRASLFGMGGFRIKDHKGDTITVLGLSSPKAPGRTVTVTGTFMAAFSLNDLFLPVILVAG